MAARAGQDDDDDDKPKEIIKLDPNDVQDIIMADDLAALNAEDLKHSNDNNQKSKLKSKSKSRSRKNSGKKGKFRELFGKKKKGNNDDSDEDESEDDEEEEEMNGGDNDDIKEDDTNKPERVIMNEDDRNILDEFCKTMTGDSVEVMSIQKIKDNAAKTIVYNALLTAKKEELKDKNVDQIERVLFHGMSFI